MAKQEKPDLAGCSEEELKGILHTLDLQLVEENRKAARVLQDEIRPLEKKLASLWRVRNTVVKGIEVLKETRVAVAVRIEQIHKDHYQARVAEFIAKEMPRHAQVLQGSEAFQVKALGDVLGVVLQNPTFRKHLPEIVEPDLKHFHLRDSVQRIALERPGARLRMVICTDGTYGVDIREEAGHRALIVLNANQPEPKFDPFGVSENTMQSAGWLLSCGNIIMPRTLGNYSSQRSPAPA